jgi:hypothetical protein
MVDEHSPGQKSSSGSVPASVPSLAQAAARLDHLDQGDRAEGQELSRDASFTRELVTARLDVAQKLRRTHGEAPGGGPERGEEKKHEDPLDSAHAETSCTGCAEIL